ncbi:hypothetical protein MLD38_039526 [Melastoma candidum]|uniref:Uncharacterized protein n=1 Tax=Melastoma candidum TaxID=119954 RepID=A0ACB9L392_9MYRT|nr:hypothetical protein MLD38_039526 [Melastoma candidum]
MCAAEVVSVHIILLVPHFARIVAATILYANDPADPRPTTQPDYIEGLVDAPGTILVNQRGVAAGMTVLPVVWRALVRVQLPVSSSNAAKEHEEDKESGTARHSSETYRRQAALLRVSSSSPTSPSDHSAVLRYIKECEDLRLSMQPLDLIKRVRGIRHEAYTEPKTNQLKQTAAIDLSKRLKDFHPADDAASLKALEEWRKRKMERARQPGGIGNEWNGSGLI